MGWSTKHELKCSQKPFSRGVGAWQVEQDPRLRCAVGWCSAGKVFAWLLSSSEFLSQLFHETQRLFEGPNIFQLRWRS